MARLRIQLFGAVRVSHVDATGDARLIHTVQALLAWLILHRRKTHARDALAAVFWGDQREDRARSCLSTALWRLKQALEPNGVPSGAYLISEHAMVGFNSASDHWIDVAAFEDGAHALRGLTASPHDTAAWQQAEAAIAHYTGDLLEGFYDDWALRERERLRLLYLDSLATLMTHHTGAGAFDEALQCGQQILTLDPLREDVHRELIRLHLGRGHRALALHQYEQCRTLLDEELGIPPMEETQALCAPLLPPGAALVTTGRARPAASGVITSPGSPSGLAASLRAAASSLEDARRAILEALRVAESGPRRH
ncbi:MAG: hypothetical protein IT178_09870 [Acidobacteria bacterium]|nr:hypothetical protein [Acidobacteriota bacterium]